MHVKLAFFAVIAIVTASLLLVPEVTQAIPVDASYAVASAAG